MNLKIIHYLTIYQSVCCEYLNNRNLVRIQGELVIYQGKIKEMVFSYSFLKGHIISETLEITQLAVVGETMGRRPICKIYP